MGNIKAAPVRETDGALGELPWKWTGIEAMDGTAGPFKSAPIGSEYTRKLAGGVRMYRKRASSNVTGDWISAEQISVLDFGALGDGTTDDTTAIQAALDAATAGQTVLFPGGGATYLISAALRYPGGVRLTGTGNPMAGTGAVIKLKDSSNITATGGPSTALLVPRGWYLNNNTVDTPVVVENLGLNGNKANNGSSTACGIITYNYWSTFQDLYIVNVPSHGILQTDTAQNGSTVLINSASENSFLRNKIVTPGGHGIYSRNQSTSTNQDGYCLWNRINGTGLCGIKFDRASGWWFVGNHLYGITTNGFDFSNCFATHVIGNEIEDFGAQNTASAYYQGIAVTQLNSRGTVVTENFVGCAEPSSASSTYQYIALTAGVSQTDAHVVCTDNLLKGAGTAQGLGIVAQVNSGGALTAVVNDNRIANVNTASYTDAGATVTSSNYGSLTVTGNLTVNTHLTVAGTATPTAAAGTNAGTSPPAPVVVGKDNRMKITFGTGTSAGAGNMVTVTFATAWASTPYVVVTPLNTASQALGLFVDGSTLSTTTLKVNCTNAPSDSQANTVYGFYAVVIG